MSITVPVPVSLPSATVASELTRWRTFMRQTMEAEAWLPDWCQNRTALFWMGVNLLVALAYLGLGWAVGRFFAAFGLFPAPIWLPAGLAAAMAMLGGWRLVPGIFAGSFIVNAVVFGAGLELAAAISIGNAAGPVLGTLLTRRLRPSTGLFTRFRGVVAFILGAVLLHAAITATIGTLSLLALGGLPMDAAGASWGSWLLCDAGGTFYFAPSLALWLGVERTPPTPGQASRSRPAVLLDGFVWLATAGLAALVFSMQLTPRLPAAQLVFLLAVPLSWIALRISLRAAYTLLTLICIIASAGTVMGLGPFQGGSTVNPMQSANMLIVLCAMNILTLLALVSERREAEWALADSNLMLERRVNERTEELRLLAETDVLTGVTNRRGFMMQGEVLSQAAHREGRPLGLIIFDLDHFKAVNDCAGHAGGDRVLQLVTAGCTPALRHGDVFGRLGGEEFAVVLPGFDVAAASQIAEHLRQIIRAVEPGFVPPSGCVTASFGVAASRPGETLSQLMLRADHALYVAKNAGRDRLQIAG